MHNTTTKAAVGTSAAARILGVSAMTVTRWAKSGHLPAVRRSSGRRGGPTLDTRWAFAVSEVEKLAADRRAALAILGRGAAA